MADIWDSEYKAGYEHGKNGNVLSDLGVYIAKIMQGGETDYTRGYEDGGEERDDE